jgi:hypothetical protein
MAKQVINKVIQDKTPRIILILPFWSKKLNQMSLEAPIKLEHSDDLFIPSSKQRPNNLEGVGKPGWRETWAYLVSGAPSRKQEGTPTELVPRSLTVESRFLFPALLEGHPSRILADTGCTAMIISEDFVAKHRLKCTNTAPQEFRFANKTTYTSERITLVTITKGNYLKQVEFFVCAIKQDAILGTPWFETIEVTRLAWAERAMSFKDLVTNTVHHWESIGKPESRFKSNIRRVSYHQLSEVTRNTLWVAEIDIRTLTEQHDLEVMEMELTHKGLYNYEPEQLEKQDHKQMDSLFSSEFIQTLVDTYKTVFQKPTNLPPD